MLLLLCLRLIIANTSCVNLVLIMLCGAWLVNYEANRNTPWKSGKTQKHVR